jgi:hypothetical protein
VTTQYTPILKLALPVTGELSGTWGSVVNDNITSMVEQAVAGLSTINTWTANAHALTTADGTSSEARCAMLVLATGAGGTALTAAGEVICPAASKLYVVKNGSAYAVTVKTSAGTGVAIPAGDTAFVFCDGTNVNACVTTIVNGHISGNLTVDGNTTLGDATSDTITATARFNTDLLPSTDNARDLGSSGNSWRTLYCETSVIAANITISGNTISSTDTNGNIIVAPNGTGDVQLDADTIRVGDSGANVTITSNGAGDLILNTNSGTNSGSITIEDGANGNITVATNGTGDVYLDADTVRIGDSNANATLTTNGTGDLILNTNAGTNSGSITIEDGANGNITISTNGTGITTMTTAVEMSATTQNISLGASQTTGTFVLGGTAATGAITLDQSTKAHTLNIGTGATENALTKTINIGTGGVSGSTTTITIGSSNGTTTTFNGTVNVTTLDLTNLEVTNIKAKDGTASITLADSTGVATFSANPILNAGTANGVVYLNASKVATTGSALTFDGTNLSSTGGATFEGGPTGYGGGEVRLGTTASGQSSAISTQSTGSPVLLFDHRGTSNTGSFVWRNGSNASAELMRLSGVTGGVGALGIGYSTLTSVGDSGLAVLGNVGIGTSSPANKLHVNSGASTTAALIESTGTSVFAGLKNSGSIAYIGSDNTGAFLVQTPGSGFSTKLTVDTSGNVGIGTSSPQAKLQVLNQIKVSDSTQAQGALVLGDGGSTSFNVGIARWNGATNAAGAGGVGYFSQGSSNAGGHYFYTGDAQAGSTTLRMTLDSSGNLGIGTTSPAGVLNIKTSNGQFLVQNGTSAAQMRISAFNNAGNANAALIFEGYASEYGRFDASGNLGIGTPTPDNKLEVTVGDNAGINIEQSGVGQTGFLNFRDFDGALQGRISYDHATDALRFATSNTEKVRLTSTGTLNITGAGSAGTTQAISFNGSTLVDTLVTTSTGVGIGAPSPAYKLEVNGGASDAMSLFDSTNANGAHLRFAASGTVKSFIGGAPGFLSSGTADDLGIRAVGSVLFATNGSSVDMTLDTSGNLGIGTGANVINSKLVVSDGSNKNLEVQPGATTFLFAYDRTAGDYLDLNIAGQILTFSTDNGAEKMRLTSTGTLNIVGAGTAGSTQAISFNGSTPVDTLVTTSGGLVGIGTSSPAGKLHVTGVAYFGNTGASDTQLRLGPLDASNAYFQSVSADGATGKGMIFYVGSTSMTLNSSGNLGLGVTPSAWNAGHTAMQIAFSGAIHGNDSGNNLFVNSNAYFDSVGAFRYIQTGFASSYEQNSGQHRWSTALSGTAGDLISFTQAMTLDASGNLMLGGTSTTQLDGVFGQIIGSSAKTTAGIALETSAGAYMMYTDSTDALIFWDSGSNAERARITSGGYFKASNSGAYNNSTGSYHELYSNASGDWIGYFTQSTASNPNGVVIQYTAAAPNGTGSTFLYCNDNAAVRATIRSNGGLANYQSNNVDLSDARTKTDISPLGSYWNKIAGLEIVTYKYKDQTHDDLNIGVIAQQVEQVAPEFVDADGFGETPEDGVPLKTIYNKDLTFAAIKALQEAMARIETLEAEVAALKGA